MRSVRGFGGRSCEFESRKHRSRWKHTRDEFMASECQQQRSQRGSVLGVGWGSGNQKQAASILLSLKFHKCCTGYIRTTHTHSVRPASVTYSIRFAIPTRPSKEILSRKPLMLDYGCIFGFILVWFGVLLASRVGLLGAHFGESWGRKGSKTRKRPEGFLSVVTV